MSKIIIPSCLQIALDDVGWRNGADDRAASGPSRTGMKRKHCPADYAAINRLGELLDMKINCAFVIGEWDIDNRLGKIKHISKYETWDNAAHTDKNEIDENVRIINDSPYIDIAVHGLMHGYYMQGTDNPDNSDFYYRKDKVLYMVPEDEVKIRIEAFFDLLNFYGVKKEVNSFIPPSFTYRWKEISSILCKYGIKYCSTIFEGMDYADETPFEYAGCENGIITVDRKYNIIPWDKNEADFSQIEKAYGIFGAHWPNILSINPQENDKIVEGAAKYFKECGETFGIILSKNMGFCATQTLFKRYAVISETKNTVTVDISKVPDAVGNIGKFYLSTKENIVSAQGCEIKMYEKHKNFCNYEIIPDRKIIKFKLESRD